MAYTSVETAMRLDLSQFLKDLESSEKFSKETVNELKKIFSQVQSPGIDPSGKSKKQTDELRVSIYSLNNIVRDSPYFFRI